VPAINDKTIKQNDKPQKLNAMKKILPIVFCVLLGAQNLVPLRAQKIIYVKPGIGAGPGSSWADPCTIKTAVTTAQPGDQIWMQYGNYVLLNTLVLPESVKIYGGFAGDGTEYCVADRNSANSLKTVIDAAAEAGEEFGPVVRLSDGCVLNGVTVQNGKQTGQDKNGGGVFVEDKAVIENCIITNNHAYIGGGLYAKGCVMIVNCDITDNTVSGFN
jgi:hypothetical protein